MGRKRKSEWKAIEEAASNRRDEFERKLRYAGEVLGHALVLLSKVWDEFPEFRDEAEKRSIIIVRTFEKRVVRKEFPETTVGA